jgi:hypothetical protein
MSDSDAVRKSKRCAPKRRPQRPGDLGHPIDDLVHDVGELFGPSDTAFHHPVGEQGEANNVATQKSRSRLAKDLESLNLKARAFLLLASVRLMVRRLCRL